MILVHKVKRVESVKGIELKRKEERKWKKTEVMWLSIPHCVQLDGEDGRLMTHTEGGGVRNSRHLQKASF